MKSDAKTVVWSTSFANAVLGSYMQIQNDGNLVVYDPNYRPTWTSNTYLAAC